MSYWRTFGTEQSRQMVERAGTSWAYFVHIAHKRKRPGVDLAHRLVGASDGCLTLGELLFSRSSGRSAVNPDQSAPEINVMLIDHTDNLGPEKPAVVEGQHNEA